ncbi:uncharacterized protein MELLADRAFT_90000 [Melampsora larici-populina 98AG31]|uniref:Uncharacterized protein n=1 Tax=Melampsora larici-populina (strain 98AG31 / pathotype 3-4-7) TaxID=747676 RepID=F4RVD7_MELLP|nr:uncharacterized protein MELLADRAFT_90000 [Melampsora larici-populina 98AG31]EGG03605.1 hypothetical protein MELLADRAFT_90000 [Melampsora larici-populina 98AG31]
MSSINDKIKTNLEKFNEHVKRTSERLTNRAGSTPLEDRSNVVMPDLPTPDPNAPRQTTSRSRGRGRGKKSAPVNTRSSAAARAAAASLSEANANNLSGIENSGDQTSTTEPTTNTGVNATQEQADGTTQPSQPTGLISRDQVNTGVTQMFGLLFRDQLLTGKFFMSSANRSPARRNTSTGVGLSPPCGFHSWLAANGLTVGPAPNPSTTADDPSNTNTSTRLRSHVNAISSVVTPTNQSDSTPVEPRRRLVGFVDLSKDDDTSKTSTEEPVAEKELKVICDEGGIDSNGLVALSPWFDTKMTALKGYLPLSIFNTQWLHQDLVTQSFRRCTTKEKLEESYVGHDVPVEWKMSFGEWVVAFDLYVAYLRHYTHEDTANKMAIHKQNVLDIMKENVNWPMAFRYDIAIRTSVLTIRKANGNLANPAVRNITIKRQCFRDTERYNDFLPIYAGSNPYATGGPKEHINPITGEPLRNGSFTQHTNLTPRQTQGSNVGQTFGPTHVGKPNARSWAHSNQPLYNGPGAVGYTSHGDDRRNGGCNTRGRGRNGGYFMGSGGGRDTSPPPRWNGDNSRRGEGSNSWRRDDRRNDRRTDKRDFNKGPKPYGGNGKAKLGKVPTAQMRLYTFVLSHRGFLICTCF